MSKHEQQRGSKPDTDREERIEDLELPAEQAAELRGGGAGDPGHKYHLIELKRG
jgi:hypothetical protein